MKIQIDLNEKKPAYQQGELECEINKVIALPENDFKYFISHLLEDHAFIMENKHLMGMDIRDGNRVQQCIAVRNAGGNDAVIVNSVGYNYARQSAYLPVAGVILEPQQAELYEKISGLNAEDAEIFAEHIKNILDVKEQILEKLDLKKSSNCISFHSLGIDLGYNTEMTELLQKLLLADKRFAAVDFYFDIKEIRLYPLKPQHTYTPVAISEERYFGEAKMIGYLHSFRELLEDYPHDDDWIETVMIEKTITLTQKDFRFFGQNFRQEADFLEYDLDKNCADVDGAMRCFFVKSEDAEYGILLHKDVGDGTICASYLPNLDDFCTEQEMKYQTGQAAKTQNEGMEMAGF